MDRRRLALIMVGGMAGASLRWFVGDIADVGNLPVGTFAVNMVGSFLVGMVLVDIRLTDTARVTIATGFCGGLTTFSTFAIELAQYRRDGDIALGVTYLLASVVVAYFAFDLGQRAAVRTVAA